MPTARWDLAVGVVHGILYAVGGVGRDFLGTVEAYDPTTDAWTTKAIMPTVRAGLAVGVVKGILYAVGGAHGPYPYVALNTVEAYDAVTNTWTAKAPMPTARSGLAVSVVNGILYAMGGSNSGTVLNTVEAYDPVTNTWTPKASMPTARFALAVGDVNNILYAVGGSRSYTITKSDLELVQSYDPSTNTWGAQAPMPTKRAFLAAGVVNNILYAVGGIKPGGPVTTVEAFTP